MPLLAIAPMVSPGVKQTVCSTNQVKGASYLNTIFNGSSEKVLRTISHTDGYGFHSEAFGKEYRGLSKADAAGDEEGIFDHMALSSDFLEQYYAQVKILNI